ncbi:hypothetical protein ACIBHX_08480 [Nonomuraea sp. NPDC050536]|uniref:hypothetical protein n=1 Tax=Nonomuraea sp. NPDC050536 TaxID=3364366 RepID=UPI0037C59F7C
MKRIIILVVAAIMLTGCGVELDAKEVHSAQSFPFTGGTLTVKTTLGGLRVEPGAAGSVQVDRWLRRKAAQEGNATWSLKDGTLRLGASCRIVFGDCGGRYHVKVPPGVKLVIDGDDDGVIVNGLTQDTTVSSSGRIRVYDTSGALRLNGRDDGISGERIKSTDVKVRNSGGGIDLTFAVAPTRLDLMADDGNVTATVPDGQYAVTVKSDDGRARSQIKDAGSSAGRTIIARSGAGEVRINRG